MSARYRLGLVLALILQLGLLGWMIAERALLLQTGREVRLAVIPVDPRDFFRGDYVTLRYGISQLVSGELAGDDVFRRGETIYVTLEEGPQDASATAISHGKPADGLFLRGTVTRATREEACGPDCWRYQVAYDIEKYFVAEGTGRELEKARNDKKISVDVAVNRDGKAELKRLLSDGVVRDEQPLY